MPRLAEPKISLIYRIMQTTTFLSLVPAFRFHVRETYVFVSSRRALVAPATLFLAACGLQQLTTY